jgi:NADPH:quinone reductase-like Zn-dependent oxidoreductase
VYGEWAIVPAGCLYRYPANLSAAQACTLGVQYLTGYFALYEVGRMAAGQVAVITAASSSAGVAAIQLAKAAGVVAIATSRTGAKRDALLSIGADHVIATAEEDLAARVQEITGGAGAQVAFDPIGGAMVEPLVEAVGMGGTVILYGLLDQTPPTFGLGSLIGKNVSIHGYTVFGFTGYPDWGVPPQSESVDRATSFLTEHLGDGSLEPVIARTFRLDDVADAQRYMESNAQVGKIVVVTG